MGSPKSSGKKHAFAGPQSFMITNLLFCSHEELIEFIIKIKEQEKAEHPHGIIIFPGMKYWHPSEQPQGQAESLKVSLFNFKCYFYHSNTIS